MSIAVIDRITVRPAKRCELPWCDNRTEGLEDICDACKFEAEYCHWAMEQAGRTRTSTIIRGGLVPEKRPGR